jgi:serine/threonine-protein kinase RsbW
LKVASDPANLAGVRKAIETFATETGFDEKAVAEIGLCVNEAMANVIRHAYANRTDRPVHIKAWVDSQQITITLRDWGNGVDPSSLPQRPYNPLTPGGVGLICLRQWMDQVVYTPQPDGMLTTMVRRRR